MAERRGCGIDKGPAGHLPGRYLAAGRWSPPGRYPRQGGVPSSSSSLAAPTMTPGPGCAALAPYIPEIPATRSKWSALRAGSSYLESLISWQEFPPFREFPVPSSWFNGPADDEEGTPLPFPCSVPK